MVDPTPRNILSTAHHARQRDRRAAVQEALERLTRKGQRFGYPECCIEFFLDRFYAQSYMRKRVPLPAGWPLRGSGYIPCPVCAATYTDEELISRIEARRAPDEKPFPFGGRIL